MDANNTRIISDGGLDGPKLVGFPDGVDSYSHPIMLKPTQYRWSENTVNKGGFPQTRPGFDTSLSFDITIDPYKSWWNSIGNAQLVPQMLNFFEASNGTQSLVFVVTGSIWSATINPDGSLQSPILIAPATFNIYADQVVGCCCVQTGTIVDGIYANNLIPRNLLVMQDGLNRAAIWDGASLQIANPGKKYTTDAAGDTLYTNGWNETRIGLWMAWSGNRLWISNGPNVFASDLGDPTHFTEELTLTAGGAWTFPSNVRGLFDRGLSGTTNSELFVFVRDSTWTLASGIQQRIPDVNTGAGGWILTPNFQSKIFSSVGCIAGKSVIVHRGLIYWMGEEGLVVFDSYGTLFSSQALPPIDQEMAYSKRMQAPDGSLTCAGYTDSYVYWSIPAGPVMNGRTCNGQTQVLDRQTTIVRSIGLNGPYAYGTLGWQGTWTGIRPVEWALADAFGTSRPYAFSMDQDGVPRIWEAFQGNRCDNGQPIPWTFETRMHPMAETLFDNAIFRSARVLLDQMLGNVTMNILWRGMRGMYKQLYNGSFTATPGSVMLPLPQFTPYTNDTAQQNNSVQTRTVRTPDLRGAPDYCSSTAVESDQNDQQDHAFSLVFQMTGVAAILSYRIQADIAIDKDEGDGVEAQETGFRMNPEGMCPEAVDTGNPPPAYVMASMQQGEAFNPITPLLPEGALYQSPLPV